MTEDGAAPRLPRLRILIVARAVLAHHFGGMERHTDEVSRGLAARGHHVELWTNGLDGEGAETHENGVWMSFLANTPSGVHSPEFQAAVLDRLVSGESQFDVMIEESWSATKTIRSLRPPGRPPAITFLHGSYAAEMLSIVAADTGRGKWPRTVTRYLPGILASALREQPKLGAERFICTSRYTAETFAGLYLVPWDRLSVLPSGLNLPPMPTVSGRECARLQLGWPLRVPIVVCVGRLTPDKGFGQAIRALAGAGTAAQLAIVGGGPEEDSLRRLAERLGVADSVVFTGPVPPEQLGPYYAASDILCIPSLRYEAGGPTYVLSEGAAAGLAVIASNRAGLRSELEGRDLALLVRPGDLFELTEAMEALIGEPALRSALGTNIRRHAEKYYTLDYMLDGIEAEIAKVLATEDCRAGTHT